MRDRNKVYKKDSPSGLGSKIRRTPVHDPEFITLLAKITIKQSGGPDSTKIRQIP
jgi:hypothetical protein